MERIFECSNIFIFDTTFAFLTYFSPYVVYLYLLISVQHYLLYNRQYLFARYLYISLSIQAEAIFFI